MCEECRRWAAISVAACCVTLLGAAIARAAFAGVSIAVSRETAPPGAFAQMKVSITEPKPISTGSTSFSFGAFDALVGLALMSPAPDTYGVALVRGTSVSIDTVSTTASYGTSLDYPILTVVGHVPAAAPLGTKFPLALDPAAIQLRDPNGVVYPVDARPGQLVAAGGVAVSDVTPGSATLAAGDSVTITGTNFTPDTTVKLSEAKIARTRFVSANRIDLVLATPARMHGMMVKVSNPDGSTAIYFSYERTRSASASSDPLLRQAVPLLPPIESSSALVVLPAYAAGITYGIALQNIETADAGVTLDLVDRSGLVVATQTIDLSRGTFFVRGMTELFGQPAAPGYSVRVTSAVPVQTIGIAADEARGTATPIVPR